MRSRARAAFLVGVLGMTRGGALHAQAPPPERASAQTKQIAQRYYREGAAAFTAGQFDAALVSFRASYALVASPNSHLMIARTLRAEGGALAAYDEFDAVVAEAEACAALDPKYASTLEAARLERSRLRMQVGLLTIRVVHPTSEAQILLADQLLDPAALQKPIAVTPGEVEIVVRSARLGSQRRTTRVLPGGEAVVELDLDPIPSELAAAAHTPTIAPTAVVEPERSSPSPAWVPPPAGAERDGSDARRLAAIRGLAFAAAGVGAAGFTTFVVFGAMNHAAYDDLQGECPQGRCPASRGEDIAVGRRNQIVANVGLGLGLAGLSGGAALWFFGGHGANRDVAPAGFRPAIAVGPTSIELNGRF